MSTLELNISDGSRVDLVARFWLAERSNGRTTAKCQRKQHRAHSHLPDHRFTASMSDAGGRRKLDHEWRLEVAK